jgi:hypothetical protein
LPVLVISAVSPATIPQYLARSYHPDFIIFSRRGLFIADENPTPSRACKQNLRPGVLAATSVCNGELRAVSRCTGFPEEPPSVPKRLGATRAVLLLARKASGQLINSVLTFRFNLQIRHLARKQGGAFLFWQKQSQYPGGPLLSSAPVPRYSLQNTPSLVAMVGGLIGANAVFACLERTRGAAYSAAVASAT